MTKFSETKLPTRDLKRFSRNHATFRLDPYNRGNGPAKPLFLGLPGIPLLRFHRIGHLTLRSLKSLDAI